MAAGGDVQISLSFSLKRYAGTLPKIAFPILVQIINLVNEIFRERAMGKVSTSKEATKPKNVLGIPDQLIRRALSGDPGNFILSLC